MSGPRLPLPLLAILSMTVVEMWQFQARGLPMPDQDRTELEFELLKRIEMERLREQIASELGLVEVRGEPEDDPPSKLPESFVQKLLAEHRKTREEKPQKSRARLLFSPINPNLQCLWHTDDACRRYEFRIPPAMLYKTAEFWMFQTGRLANGSQTITALCSNPRDGVEHLMEQDDIPERSGEESEWRSFELPLLHKLTYWSGSIVCAIEITGTEIDNDQNPARLEIAQDLDHLNRQRREAAGLEESCRPVPFQVFFRDIGFEQHFSYPESFNAYACKGHCVRSRNFYQTVMEMVFERNTTLKTQYGDCWASRCTPKDFDNMDVIFRSKVEGGGAVHNVTTLTKIIARTCTCR